MNAKANLLRAIPSVDALMMDADNLIARFGREPVREAIRHVLRDRRGQILMGEVPDLDISTILSAVQQTLNLMTKPTLRGVINATGVIIHTNLGRAVLCETARQAVEEVGAGYNTLEFDLENGKRGTRAVHAETLLTSITGAEAALVVNNNAAATVLMLSALAMGREVILSRGQLVEIGGGFRVPDIMEQSGAKLVEVGTTNRTRARDYAAAVTENTALLMRVHSSNFKQIGFTEETPLEELAQIARERKLHLVDDLGSGALLDTAAYGLDHEPTVQESLAAGVDVIAFSGDKLLGGPQAGILVGKAALIDQLKRHPLARAIRADKMSLAALCATLEHYRRGDVIESIPVWQMIAKPLEQIRVQAVEWCGAFDGVPVSVIDGESTVGGGSLPGATLPTALLALEVAHPDSFMASLRQCETPIIARILDNRVVFDPRTVFKHQHQALIGGIHAAIARQKGE